MSQMTEGGTRRRTAARKGRAPDLGEYYTPEEIAESLRVTRRTVYDWLKSGRLPGLRVGRSWRINREALLAFLRPPILQSSPPLTAPPPAQLREFSPQEIREFMEADQLDAETAPP